MLKIPRILLPATLDLARVSRPEFSGQKSNARKLASKKTKSPSLSGQASGDSAPTPVGRSNPGGGCPVCSYPLALSSREAVGATDARGRRFPGGRNKGAAKAAPSPQEDPRQVPLPWAPRHLEGVE
jgi:hypothetical protein